MLITKADEPGVAEPGLLEPGLPLGVARPRVGERAGGVAIGCLDLDG